MKRFILILLSILALTSVVGLVYGYTVIFPPEIRGGGVLSEMYLDDERQNSTVVVYRSSTSIADYELFSSCDTQSQFLESNRGLYFFGIDYSRDPECDDTSIFLSLNGVKVEGSEKKAIFKSSFHDLSIFLDYSSKDLRNFRKKLKNQAKKNSIYANYRGKHISKNYRYFIKQRDFFSAKKRIALIDDILEKRELKYISPVPGKSFSDSATKLPNSPRPYRSGYTDGIHHGWDIDTHFGDNVVALDDGVILRIRRDFTDESYNDIVYGESLTYEQKLKNLDVLRGNQVWLKTMKGEVIFYSHLDEVSPNIKEGMLVKRGEKFGTVGVTGVPADDYHDYHLHFAVMMNPYDQALAGTYQRGDYLAWDWSGRYLSYNEVIQLRKEMFEE